MKRQLLATLVAAIVASSLGYAADESVSAARELYAAAAYEDALILLNRLRASSRASDETRTIEQYRAFCLLALGRRDDAEQAIAAVVAGEPSYRPSEAEVSPRVRSAFSDVRRRMLPAITQEKYAVAKAAFDRKQFVAAADGFKQVLALLNDPDIGPAAAQPPLSDLRTLAAGFVDLSAQAMPAPPTQMPVPPPPPAPTLPIAAAPPAPAPVRGRIYGAEDTNVVPPVPLRQVVPPFQYQSLATTPGQGVLEVVIGETGNVEAAVMRVPIFPRYDPLLIEAARSWKYKPAKLQGMPVMYRKMVAINVKRTQ